MHMPKCIISFPVTSYSSSGLRWGVTSPRKPPWPPTLRLDALMGSHSTFSSYYIIIPFYLSVSCSPNQTITPMAVSWLGPQYPSQHEPRFLRRSIHAIWGWRTLCWGLTCAWTGGYPLDASSNPHSNCPAHLMLRLCPNLAQCNKYMRKAWMSHFLINDKLFNCSTELPNVHPQWVYNPDVTKSQMKPPSHHPLPFEQNPALEHIPGMDQT